MVILSRITPALAFTKFGTLWIRLKDVGSSSSFSFGRNASSPFAASVPAIA